MFFDENDLAKGTVLTAAEDFTIKKTKNRVEIAAKSRSFSNTLVVWGASGRSYKFNLRSTLDPNEHADNVWIKVRKVKESKEVQASNGIDYVALTKIMINYNDEEMAKGFGSVPTGVRVRDVRTEDNKPIAFHSIVWPGFLLVQKKQFETSRFIGHTYEVFNTLDTENYLDVRKIGSKGIELVTPTAHQHSPRGQTGSTSKLFVVLSELVKDKYFFQREQRESQLKEEDSVIEEETSKTSGPKLGR
jgi:hypothetical protein